MSKHPHEFVKSTLNHGTLQCKWCLGTERELSVINPDHCTSREREEMAARDARPVLPKAPPGAKPTTTGRYKAAIKHQLEKAAHQEEHKHGSKLNRYLFEALSCLEGDALVRLAEVFRLAYLDIGSPPLSSVTETQERKEETALYFPPDWTPDNMAEAQKEALQKIVKANAPWAHGLEIGYDVDDNKRCFILSHNATISRFKTVRELAEYIERKNAKRNF